MRSCITRHRFLSLVLFKFKVLSLLWFNKWYIIYRTVIYWYLYLSLYYVLELILEPVLLLMRMIEWLSILQALYKLKIDKLLYRCCIKCDGSSNSVANSTRHFYHSFFFWFLFITPWWMTIIYDGYPYIAWISWLITLYQFWSLGSTR